MDTPQNSNGAAAKEFLVTGVSRSGRVRKKSSKLLDFQSPDEVEKKPKRIPKPVRSRHYSGSARAGVGVRRALHEIGTDDMAEDDDDMLDDMEQQEGGLLLTPHSAADSSFITPDSDDELDELVADLVEGVEAESMEHANNDGLGESKVRQSLYMTEKSNKRKMLKDGKVVTGKLERKDKGKSRYTAYSLWAREFRKTSKFSKNQDIDFSNAARRLGELWANVSNKEKSTWRRKAKLQATKAKAREKNVINNEIAANPASFLNRATTSRTKKLAADRQTPIPIPMKAQTSKRRSNNNNLAGSNAAVTNLSGYMSAGQANYTTSSSNSFTNNHISSDVESIEPIDAAAHLKLLGDSLTTIGERLMEHEGQIAVSGSLSVLLDSLLCSIGPLLCLTTHIPGLESKKPPKLCENLASTLDNIAYVMPGL